MLPNFTYVRVKTLSEALRQLAAPGARVHAGGTDLLGCLRDGVFKADRVVSLGRLDELRGIAASATGLRIGALTTVAEVAADARIAGQYAAVAQAAGEVASPQLRHQGTIGGNLCQRPRCWYFRGDFHCLRKGGDQCFAVTGQSQYHAIFGGNACYIVHPSDTAPALVALGGRVRIASAGGTRAVSLSSFFVTPDKAITRETILEPGELVTEVLLPAPDPALRSVYRKVRARGSWDFALASVAVALKFGGDVVEQARVVLGGVAPVPWRSAAAEKALAGNRLTPDVAARAGAAAAAAAEPLGQNGYKVEMVQGVVQEALLSLRP